MRVSRLPTSPATHLTAMQAEAVPALDPYHFGQAYHHLILGRIGKKP
jgi:hypothetical protein